jgi:hypothetical protein
MARYPKWLSFPARLYFCHHIVAMTQAQIRNAALDNAYEMLNFGEWFSRILLAILFQKFPYSHPGYICFTASHFSRDMLNSVYVLIRHPNCHLHAWLFLLSQIGIFSIIRENCFS